MKMASKKKLALEWFGMTEIDCFKANLPMDKAKLARHLRVGKSTISDWEARYYAEKIIEQVEAKSPALLPTEVVEEPVLPQDFDEEDPEGWWQKKKIELNEAILKSAKAGNATSQRLAKQLAGELVEKTEIKHVISADEIARRNFEAERELREKGYSVRRADDQRMVEMSGKLPLLSNGTRTHNKQKHKPKS